MSEEKDLKNKEVLFIELGKIDAASELNCRSKINPIDVVPLVKDITENGLLQPILVRRFVPEKDGYKSDKEFQLVAGFRRFTAFQIMEKKTVPALVTDVTFSKARFLNLSENLQRKDLNILEEAKAVERLMIQGYSEEEIGIQLNMSRGWAQVRCMLLRLPEDIQHEAAAGLITQFHIRELFALPTKEQQYDIVRKIKDAKISGNKMSGEDVKAEARKHLTSQKRIRTKKEMTGMINHIIDNIKSNIGSRCLAWGCGEIATNELYDTIADYASENGLSYVKPSAEQV